MHYRTESRTRQPTSPAHHYKHNAAVKLQCSNSTKIDNYELNKRIIVPRKQY